MRKPARRTTRSLGLLTVVLACLLAAAPLWAGTMSISVRNGLHEPIVFAPAGGFQGAPVPPLPARIAPGETARSRIESPYPTSAGASLRYGPERTARRCFFVVARLRVGLDGPWSPPTARAEGDAGFSCRATVTGAMPDGDFEVLLEVE